MEKEKQIDPALKTVMNDIAHILDRVIKESKENQGFALFIFDFGTNGRINYISNAQREDMLATLKEFIAKCEGRYHA